MRHQFSRRTALISAISLAVSGKTGFANSRRHPPATVSRTYIDGTFGQVHLRQSIASQATTVPLVLLHPLPFSSRVFDTLVRLPSWNRTVLAPDIPGYGNSDAPTERPSIDDYAASLLRSLGQSYDLPVDILGYGEGAAIASAMAHLFPEQVRRVIAMEPPVGPVTDRTPTGPLDLSFAGQHLDALWATYVTPTIDQWQLMTASHNFADTTRRPTTSWWGLAATQDYDFAGQASAISHPMLWIDVDDPVQQASVSNQLAVGDNVTLSKPELSWGFLDERPTEIQKMIITFLDRDS